MGSICSRLICGSRNEVVDVPLLFPLVMRRQTIVGFTGAAGSGKDTAAEILVSQFGYHREAFADPLKKGVSALFSISDADMNDRVLKERPIDQWGGRSPRELMQWLGTDVLRKHICDDFFITSMATRLEAAPSEFIVISDVRFDGEARFIHHLGGKIIRLNRDVAQAGMDDKAKQHASERGIADHLVHSDVQNNGSIEDLIVEIEKAIPPQPF